ncbi:hypothetical protein [Dyella sp. 333MFSha]|uniref:hypothetical protein n=1 Tax=Dyella sp. 333MFSha TaxID=1798240 RepID=UPI00088316BD|nr:hypothetical protein [Dyella sp. 333MFSha]SDF40294.1 hypothetical protein SAMN04515659_0867 [Dyella sp. 333MFSha]
MTIRRLRFLLLHAVFANSQAGRVLALPFAAGLALTSIFAPSAKAATSAVVPANIQALMVPGDTVLAFQPVKPFGAERAGGALVVRHAQPTSSTGNACELWLLRATGATYAVTLKNGEAIDCRYNESAKNALPMALNHNLTVSPTSVAYFNELPRGGTTYAFGWDGQKRVWHLQQVEATSVENGESGVIVSKSVLDYPATLPWLTIDAFSPKAIREALHAHRTVFH